jgi:hypothetical protein
MSITETEESTITPDDNPSQHLLDAVTIQRDALQLELGELGADLATFRAERNTAIVDRDAMQEQLEDLRTERERVERLLWDKTTELDEFKEKVIEVAGRYTDKYGWCSTVNEALAELDLGLQPSKYQATLQITVRFSAEMSNRRDLPEGHWVNDSIERGQLQRLIENNFRLDSDHSSSVVDDVEFEVTSVSEDTE